MPQFTEKKKMILTLLVINCEMNHLTGNEALKYIKQAYGKDISRRTYYNYKESVFKNCEKSLLDNNGKINPSLSLCCDLSKANKALISMAMMTEKISIVRQGARMGIKLSKYDKPIDSLHDKEANVDNRTKLILDKSRNLLEKINSRKNQNKH